MKEKFTPNHLHLICRGKCLNPPKQEKVLDEWLTELVHIVDMNILIKPKSIYVDNEPGNEGITGTVVLSTSHASIHIWDRQDPAILQFDIYSCAPFNVEEVISHLQKFQLTELQWIRIDRNDGLNITDQGELEFSSDEYDDMKTNFDEFVKNYN